MRLSEYIKLHPKQLEALKLLGTGARVFYGGARGGGKASSLSSLVSTPYGFRQMRDIEVGALVSNPDGSVATVIATHPQGVMPIYEVEFADGAKTKVTGDHLWQATISNKMTKRNGIRGVYPKVYTTLMLKDILDKVEIGKPYNNYPLIPLTEPVTYTMPKNRYTRELFDPYLLGLLIGDGHIGLTSISIATEDKEIENYLVDCAKKYNYETVIDSRDTYDVVRFNQTAVIKEHLEYLNLLGKHAWDKFIPEQYKYSSIENRIALIQGLFDTDGYVDSRGHVSYTTVSETLANDVQWIARSLGCKATVTQDIGKYRGKDGEIIECRDVYTVYVNGKASTKFFRITRKKERAEYYKYNGNDVDLKRRMISIKYVGEEEAKCITVDNPNSLYITDDFIVTHNSYLSLAAAVIACLQYPKLRAVIVRKTYPELQDNFISILRDKFPAEVFGYKYRVSEKSATFDNGSQILFRSCETEEDTRKVQGVEYQLMIIDEANNFEERVIHRFIGSLRSSLGYAFVPTLLMTGNPGGYADNYFKSRYIYPDTKQWTDYEVRHQDKYIFVSAKLEDNPSVDESYKDMLDSLPDDLRRAWRDGDWSMFEGMFFTEWNMGEHIVDPFDIPPHWDRVMSLDLGFTEDHPTVAIFTAQDPETLKLYVYDEYVGVGSIDRYIDELKPIVETQSFKGIYADPSMFYNNTMRSDMDESPAAMFRREGIWLEKANNDRINGWRIVKQWLHWTKPNTSRIKVFSTCYNLIETLPTLRFAKSIAGVKREDLDTKMADDSADALRYNLISGWGVPTSSDFKGLEEIIERKLANHELLNKDDFYDSVYASQRAYYL